MPSQTAGRRRRHRHGGAYEIKQEGDKWYIYVRGVKDTKAYDSFSAAKTALEEAKANVDAAKTLTDMKKNGGRRTRRHRRRHH